MENLTDNPTHYKMTYDSTGNLPPIDITICSRMTLMLNVTKLEQNFNNIDQLPVDEVHLTLEDVVSLIAVLPDLYNLTKQLLAASHYSLSDFHLNRGYSRINRMFYGDLTAAFSHLQKE